MIWLLMYASYFDRWSVQYKACCNFFVMGIIVQDDMDKKIRELTNELECANRKCEVYRANLLSVLKDIEEHKLQLSIKVENIKIGMKDGL